MGPLPCRDTLSGFVGNPGFVGESPNIGIILTYEHARRPGQPFVQGPSQVLPGLQ